MSAGQVVRRLAGIQAQFPSAAGLAVKARTVDLVSGDVERALHEERSIVRTWAMRGTLHLITAEDYPWLVPLTTSFSGARRRLTQEGVPADRAAKAVRLIERMLEKEGPLTRAEIVERLTRRGIRTQGQAGAHLVRLAALEGVVCHGPNRDGEPTFVVVRDWLPQERSKGPDVPLGELALRYLAAHAPAGPEDLAAWSGVRLSDARRGWQEIADSLVEVEVQGTALWMLRSQTFDAPHGIVRLTPAFDPYILGWRSEFALPKEHEREIFRGGGMFRPAIIADGRAVGAWGTERRRGRLVLRVRPFSRPGPAIRRTVRAEADDVGRFLGTAAEPVIEPLR